ncbi:DUF4836 family protein [Chitinophaga cymbidii]|uniref:DUF4836 domain-containing protein n=1 Tax=Chitinophaga cymbidii TaxID=1096750 RepID=A0A512RHP0_9BACT|nr:DUF4836 family protein [Chitinophaga cymbidii]GEP95207.1 hypothetical protein CCY01nite_14670 [Chitinophaga cymbidii]
MKRTLTRALLSMTGAAMLLLAACSKTPEQGKHIPKSAALVLGINSKQIQQKLVTEGLTVEKLFESLQQKDTSNAMTKAMKEAENSGVDLQSDVYVAMVPGESGPAYIAAYAALKDASKFEAFIKEKSKKEVKAGTDFKYVADENGNGVLGFDKNMVIGIFGFDPNSARFGGRDQTPGGLDEKSATDILNNLFHMKADESIAGVESFKAVHKEKGDVVFWMSSEQIYAFNPGTPTGMGALMSNNMKKLTAGSFQTAAVHFENGKIRVNSLSYAGKEMQDIMKKYPMEKVNISMLENYPSEDIFGFALLNFDLRMIGDIIKLVGMDGLANVGLAEAGLTLDDILKAFKGELALIGSDFSVKSQPSEWDSSYKVTKPELKWVFNMKVGDKAAFEKVMNSPMVGQMFTKQGEEYVPNQPLGPVAVSINDKRILAASDASLLSAYDAGKGKANVESSVLSKTKGSVMSMYLSVEKLVNNIPAEEMKLPDSVLNDLKGLLKDFTVVTEPSSGKTQKSVLELNFKNENQNTLVQITNFTTKMYNYYMAKKAEEDAMWGEPVTDTTTAIVDSAIAVPAQ